MYPVATIARIATTIATTVILPARAVYRPYRALNPVLSCTGYYRVYTVDNALLVVFSCCGGLSKLLRLGSVLAGLPYIRIFGLFGHIYTLLAL